MNGSEITGRPRPIRPEMALREGRFDPAALSTIWLLRKSFPWMMSLGLISLALTDHLDDTDVDWTSPGLLVEEILSPLAGVIFAVVFRFLAAQLGLWLTYPLAHRHDLDLAPRTGFGHSIGVAFDRLHVMRAYRSLRWTHHVRQLAHHRLGRWGDRLGRLDPIIDVVNITMVVLAFVAVFWWAADAAATAG